MKRGLSLGAAVLVVIAAAAGVLWIRAFPFALGRHRQEQRLIWQQARREHLDPWLVTAVVEVESHFRPGAVSPRGAVGLMQILPTTGQWVEAQANLHGPLDSPRVNIAVGTWYLAYLSRVFHGRLVLILAAYNGGPETVERWTESGRLDRDDPVSHIPYPETRTFVTRVLWHYRFFRWVAQH